MFPESKVTEIRRKSRKLGRRLKSVSKRIAAGKRFPIRYPMKVQI